MKYTTKSGFILSDDDLDALGDACERGEYPGRVGAVIVAPVGRPRLYSEDLVTVAFKIPRSFRDKLDAEAVRKKESRSELLRGILNSSLS